MSTQARLKRLGVFSILAVVLAVANIRLFIPKSVKAQADEGIDLALTINGSGSISDEDFTLQKEGLKRAIQNPGILPRDGSISLTIIQYANAVTQVHVPLTTINDNTDASNIVTIINGITQIGGSTNPGDGIVTADEVFNNDGSPDHNQVICLSTDGLPNSGANVSTSLENAKNSPIELDKFTVIAIEDPPHFYADDFHGYYDPLVFGGGVVTVVENSLEYANSVGGCMTNAVEVIGFEVNQAIQDWNNSVQLIERKVTYVRAHIQTVGSENTTVFARLHGSRNGEVLPTSPITVPPFLAEPPDAADRRGDLDSSMNIRIPYSWLEGTVTLKLETVGSAIDCAPAASLSDDCEIEITFNPTADLEVQFVAVEYDNAAGDHIDLPFSLFEVASRLRAMYPLGILDLSWIPDRIDWDEDVPPDVDDVTDEMAWMRFADYCWGILGCERIYYGVIPQDGEAPPGGGLGVADDIPGNVASGYLPEGAFALGRNTHAHEIGHVLGRHHAVFDIVLLPPGKEGACGEVASLLAPDFPYRANVPGFGDVAPIGPMDQTENDLIYGLDTRLITSSDATARTNAVIDPNEHFELMSYCGIWLWISDYTYDGLFEEINDRFEAEESAVTTSSSAVQDFMVLRGRINLETDEVTFLPFGVIPSSVQPPGLPTGEYAIQLLDSSGETIEEILFEPISHHGRDSKKEFGRFIIPVLADPAIQQAIVLHEEVPLGSIVASANPPTVEVIFPNGGESLGGLTATFEWSGADLDGDELTYLLQFSPDGGATWQTLVTNWSAQTYVVPLNMLEETSNGVFRVMASDGFNASSDVSDGTFSVPNNPPQVNINAPMPKSLYVGTQLINFDGEANDLEDGILSGSSLEWRSDVDGILGFGESMSLEATSLSEGDHTISLTATDSGGLKATTSVGIRVFRLEPTASVIMEKTVFPDVVQPGEIVQYTIVLENEGVGDAEGVSIEDTLPPGFIYQLGSSSGLTTSDPLIESQLLTWAGPFTIPAASFVELRFSSMSSTHPGTFYNSVSATSTNTLIPSTGNTAPVEVRVNIDIWPFLDHNIIILDEAHPIPAAILSTDTFDAPTEVNRTSLTFGRTGNEESLDFCFDIPDIILDFNEDGLEDLGCVFHSSLAGFQLGDVEGVIRGQTIDGILIEGRDSILVAPSRDARSFKAILNGANEVPPVETGAAGIAVFNINPRAEALRYRLDVARIDNVTAVHVHCAPKGVNGPVGVTMYDGPPVTTSTFRGMITSPDEGNLCGWTDLDAILTAMWSGDTYVNVHTLDYPTGEIRGQIEIVER